MARPLFDSEYIFSIHEPGGEGEMIAAGKPGWIVFTEGIGSEPNDRSGRDYTPYSNQGLGIITRLNNGYHPAGTIPYSHRYADFAQRCANFVAASRGCKIWIIGNEMNFAIERPQDGAVAAAVVMPPGPAEAGPDGADEKAEPAGRWSRWWNRILRAVSGGMGSAELGRPLPPSAPPISAPPGALPVPAPATPAAAPVADPDSNDPYHHSDPSRFSALTVYRDDGISAACAGETDDPSPPPAFDPRPSELPAVAAAAAAVEQVITPDLYAECYRLCRAAIHAVPGHAGDQVLVGAVAPWNNQTRYPGNTIGDRVQYMRDILLKLGGDGCDGITLHTYTHQADPDLIHSDAKMAAPFEDRHFEFRAYQDFMHGIPNNMRHLPVYITETDQDVAWLNQNSGWVQQAYGEINWWNQQTGNQQIRALALYRWPRIDKWHIEGKQGVIDDFKQALTFDYRWSAAALPPVPPSASFKLDDVLATTDIVNMRATPGYVGKPAGDVVAELPTGALVTILSSTPQSVDGLIWWNVSHIAAGVENRGWLAQFSPAGVPLVRRTEDGSPPPVDPNIIGIGSRVETLDVVRMRRSPGYTNKPATDVVADIALGVQGGVIDGSRLVDGLTWWQVNTVDSNGTVLTGWMAETAPNGVRLLESVGDLAPAGQGGVAKFAKGDSVETLDIVRLRQSPGYQGKPAGDIVADLPAATRGTVIGGPQGADALTWWQLDTVNAAGAPVRGWAAEVAPSGVVLLDRSGGGEPAPAKGSIKSGDHVQTLDIVRVRKTPGYRSKAQDDVITDVPAGAMGVVKDGPRSKDDLAWWRIHVPTLNVEGWMAQSSPAGQQLLSLAATSGMGNFGVGELVQAATEVRVRQSPGYVDKGQADVLGGFERGTTMNIIGGPRAADGLIWWNVGGISLASAELVGWVAETAPDGVTLIRRVPKLPGTNFPDRASGSYLGRPIEDASASRSSGARIRKSTAALAMTEPP